jgi:hypothetical protein
MGFYGRSKNYNRILMCKWFGKQLLKRSYENTCSNVDWIKVQRDTVILIELEFCPLLPSVVVADVTAAANNFVLCMLLM